MASSTHKLSRTEWKQKADLDAARKAGTVPAEVDEETGRDINPHIPQYMAQTPWYVDTGTVTMRHQQAPSKPADEKTWYQRGATLGTATKYRKGACENCGSMTHKRKDCLDRPRTVGAKWTGSDIKADEVVTSFNLSYDGKRDRWNGYDPSEYEEHIKEWEQVDEKRKAIKAAELETTLAAKKNDGEASDEEDVKQDDDKYADEADMAGQKVDANKRITVRNLRIREDTAKYLRNLDVDSAYYDPKSRAMRQNPNPDKDPTEATFIGDNALRHTGDVSKIGSMQLFAWEASSKGVDVHLQATPTAVEFMAREFNKKKNELQGTQKAGVLEKYGGAEHLQAPPKELLMAQSERYVEYTRSGQLVSGQEEAIAKSKYEEDVFPQNHASVWGSYWEDGQWGFKCCQNFVRNSYCLGASNIQLRREAKEQAANAGSSMPPPPTETPHVTTDSAGAASKTGKGPTSLGRSDVEQRPLDSDKLADAIRAEEERQRSSGNDDRKRKYNSLSGGSLEVTAEELEAYRLKRLNAEDPMLNAKDFDA